jgi:hypothetical protein
MLQATRKPRKRCGVVCCQRRVFRRQEPIRLQQEAAERRAMAVDITKPGHGHQLISQRQRANGRKPKWKKVSDGFRIYDTKAQQGRENGIAFLAWWVAHDEGPLTPNRFFWLFHFARNFLLPMRVDNLK